MTEPRILNAHELAAGLRGRAPEPFVVGHRLELVMFNGRLVRGEVVAAGARVAQIKVGMVKRWKDANGSWRPPYPHLNPIVYGQVRRWAEPAKVAPDGTWMPDQPGFRAQAHLASMSEWHEWRRR